MATSLTKPLSPGKQILLQRLIAAHVLSHADCLQIFEQCNDDDDCGKLEDCFRIINEELMAGFGLEIATTVMKGGNKYHAVVNPHSDDEIAQASFGATLPPAEREYTRKVLESLVQNDDQEDQKNTRMDLINLRNTLDQKYKMNVEETEHCLDRLLDEHWLSKEATEQGNKENRRKSMKTAYAIGPRTYLELRHLLNDFGLEELPQCIYHRAV